MKPSKKRLVFIAASVAVIALVWVSTGFYIQNRTETAVGDFDAEIYFTVDRIASQCKPLLEEGRVERLTSVLASVNIPRHIQYLHVKDSNGKLLAEKGRVDNYVSTRDFRMKIMSIPAGDDSGVEMIVEGETSGDVLGELVAGVSVNAFMDLQTNNQRQNLAIFIFAAVLSLVVAISGLIFSTAERKVITSEHEDAGFEVKVSTPPATACESGDTPKRIQERKKKPDLDSDDTPAPA